MMDKTDSLLKWVIALVIVVFAFMAYRDHYAKKDAEFKRDSLRKLLDDLARHRDHNPPRPRY